MTIFEEKVQPTFTAENVNFLTVVEFTEDFFDLYKIKVNDAYYIAEKCGEYNDNPIVTIPVYFEGKTTQMPFVLAKGSKQEIIFNPKVCSIVTKIPTRSVQEIVDESAHEEVVEQFDIGDSIDRAKQKTIDYVERISEQYEKQIQDFLAERDEKIQSLLQSTKVDLLQEFNSVSDNLSKTTEKSAKEFRNEVITQLKTATNRLETKINETIEAKEQTVLKAIKSNLDTIIEKEIKPNLSSTVREQEIFLGEVAANLNNELNKSILRVVEDTATKIEELEQNLEENTSRVLAEKIEELDTRLVKAQSIIEQTYDNKFRDISSANKSERGRIQKLVEESKQLVLNEIKAIKAELPKLITEKRSKNDLKTLQNNVEQTISARFNSEMVKLKRYISLSSGGGSGGGTTFSGSLTGGVGITDGDKGDITVSGTGTVWTIDDGVVSTSKLGGDITTAGKALLDDANAAAQRTTLGLGTLATQNGTFSGTSSGTNTGDQSIFQTISVVGQSSVVADTTTDTLTLSAGSNIVITTNATNDTIAIHSTASGITDGDKGDITVSSSGSVWTIDSGVVNLDNLGGDITTVGKALLSAASVSAQRDTLGLGTLATQNGTFSGTSSGTNTGDQNIFSTISVQGQSDVVADTTADTLTLSAGTGIVITTNATGDIITFTSTASSSGGISDGDKGDITVSSSGSVWTIDSGAVNLGKLGGEITSIGKAVLSGADAAAIRATLEIALTGTNTGDQNLFSTLSVIGQTNIVAINTTDTVTISAGPGIILNTSTNPNILTITSTASGGSSTSSEQSPIPLLAAIWG